MIINRFYLFALMLFFAGGIHLYAAERDLGSSCGNVCLAFSVCFCCQRLIPETILCVQACRKKNAYIGIIKDDDILNAEKIPDDDTLNAEKISLVYVNKHSLKKGFAGCPRKCNFGVHYKKSLTDDSMVMSTCSCCIFLCNVGPEEPSIEQKCILCKKKFSRLSSGDKVFYCSYITALCCCLPQKVASEVGIELPLLEGAAALPLTLGYSIFAAEAGCLFCGKNAARYFATKIEPYLVVLAEAPKQEHMDKLKKS